MKQFVVVAYDIADDRRRQKTAKILIQYGLRCNESVFECLLTESKIQNMKAQIAKVIDQQEDIVLFYFLCKPCVMKRENFGRRLGFKPETVVV